MIGVGGQAANSIGENEKQVDDSRQRCYCEGSTKN